MITIKNTTTRIFLNLMKNISLFLSPKFRYWFGILIGSLFFKVIKKRKKHAYYQLKKSFPKKSNSEILKILKKTHIHFGQMFIDAISTIKIVKNEDIKILNADILNKLKSKNEGFILLTAHIGNWEIIPVWLSENNFTIKTVTKNQKNKGAHFFFQNLRKKNGVNPVSIHYPTHEMIKSIKNGEVLILASDQDAGKKGEFINFFGRPASTPRGASVFYEKTKCEIIAAFCIKEKIKYSIEFVKIKPNNQYPSIMFQFTELLEKKVRKYPNQYFWFHKRWKTKNDNY